MIKRGDIIEVNFKAYSGLDVTDETLMVEDSMQDASEYVGASSRSNIYSAIHNVEGRKTCKGYAWKYV